MKLFIKDDNNAIKKLLMINILFIISSFYDITEYFRQNDRIQVIAEIVNVKNSTDTNGKGQRYYYSTLYFEYKFNEKLYQNKTTKNVTDNNPHYNIGEKLIIWIYPDKPENFIFEKGMWVLLSIKLVLWFLIDAIAIIVFMFTKMQEM